MLHPSRQGIFCDLCGKEVLISDKSIKYCGVNIRQVESFAKRPNDVNDVLDIECCSECFEPLRNKVAQVAKENNQKAQNESIRPRAHIHRNRRS